MKLEQKGPPIRRVAGGLKRRVGALFFFFGGGFAVRKAGVLLV